jgi:hypothetical protein
MDWLDSFVPPITKDVDEDFIRGFLGKCCLAVMKFQRNQC